jgi:hypothetical protein
VRNINATTLAALSADKCGWVMAAEMIFDSGALRLVSGIAPVTIGGTVCTPSGTLGAISPLEEGQDVATSGLTLTLSGIDTSMTAIVLGERYLGRPVKCYLLALSESGGIIGEPFEFFSGKMDEAAIKHDDREMTITVQCESDLSDLRRMNTKRFTHEEQQALYPTDKGFEYVAKLQGKSINWGKKYGPGEGPQIPGPVISNGRIYGWH